MRYSAVGTDVDGILAHVMLREVANHDDVNQDSVELDDGRRVIIRRARHGDDEALSRLGGRDFQVLHGTAGASGADQHEAYVAATPDRRVVGAAWLEIDEYKPLDARLRLALEPHLRHLGVEAALARRTAQDARERGCQRITAYVPHISSDVLASLRAAGLHIVSCLSYGGTSEVLLDVC